ncbi:oligosaccharide flippase family protein [Neobacillus niacini]|uniref:flippase n=1 Tax=Neobacillus niacini TaxID=86668 RepID=UPI00286CF280|nr:oligosaccharide flippase family protein [Neobacillus niacini]
MNKIYENYFYNMLYQVFILFIPIVTAPYLARTLGATELGIYSYVYSFTSILSSFSLLGIYSYGNRKTAYVRDNMVELNKMFWELMLIRVGLGGIGTIIFLIVASSSEYTLYFLLYYGWLLASFLDVSWLFIGLENMKPVVLKNFFAKLISVIGIFIFVNSEEDLWIYFLLMGVTTLVANLSVYGQLKSIIFKPTINKNNLNGHFIGSIQLFLPQIASLLYLQIDKIMINFFTSTTNQVAFYDQAEKVILIPMTLITVLSTVMMPRIANDYAKGNIETVNRYVLKAGEISLFLAIPMAVGIAGIANNFIPWYLGNEFIPTIYAIIILSPLIISNSLIGVFGNQYFTGTNQIGIIVKAYGTAAILNIILNGFLIPYLGFLGAAISTIISSLASLLILFYYISKQISMGPLLRTGLKYFMLSLPLAMSVFGIGFLLPASIYSTFIQISVGVLIYGLFLLLIKDQTLQMLFSRVKMTRKK